jgi:adenylate cyclase
MALNPDDARAITMGAVSLCRLGEKAKGLEWAERALEIDADDAGVRYNVACLYALEGETARAMGALEEAVRAGFANVDWIKNDPDLDSLRADPRFQTLLDKLGAA